MAYPFSKWLIPIVQKLFIKEVRGLQHIPKKGPFIIAANHQCHLDGFLLTGFIVQKTNQKAHFLAKREFTSYFGTVVEDIIYKRWAGVLFVEQSQAKNKGKKAIEQAAMFLEAKKIVGIFPEGKRTYDGSLLQGRTGIVRILIATGKKILIIPVGIQNAHRMLPRKKIIPRIWKARATISFGKPFYLPSFKKRVITKKLLRNATTVVMKKIAYEARLPYVP